MRTSVRKEFETFDASNKRVGIVVAQFNADITGKLLESALKRTEDYQIKEANVDVIAVAGAIEIPLALQRLAMAQDYYALVAIGCIIKGDTPHFDYVCKFVTEGILRVQLDRDLPIAFGILTCNNYQEAEDRANLGGEHLDAVLQQAHALEFLK